ncbi:DNA-binding protein [Brevibacterium ammoniilyticum]|uniref:DNA-binding protein n=1 Tax=Brevibacterium ammoniilyticum TaxID=1046555 RepID=UPI0031CFF04E
MTDQQAPEARAEAAARDLADTGRAVTARAIREVAKVRMAVASAAAKAWNEATATDEAEAIPEVPEDVQGRLAAIWADAYRAALAAVTPERDKLAAEVEQLRGEVDGLTSDVEAVEAERDEAAARAATAAESLAAAEAAQGEATASAARAEDRAAAAEAERDRLAEQVNQLIQRIPETKG